MVDTSHQPALGYMQIVPRRDAATLLPIIQQHVANRTIIWSDEWVAYNRVASLPSVSRHDSVNHSIEFVTPGGVHIQNAESYWNRVKIKLKCMRGVHEHRWPVIWMNSCTCIENGTDKLQGSVLTPLFMTLPPSTQYSLIFSQYLLHVMPLTHFSLSVWLVSELPPNIQVPSFLYTT